MHDEPDQLIAHAAHHHATGFPNPERCGCPPPGQLTAQIWRGQLPDPSLRQHLFACSECFQEYRTQLAAYQAAQPAPATWWQAWRAGWRIKSALALASLLLVSIGGWFVWQATRVAPATQIAVQTNPSPLPTREAASLLSEEKLQSYETNKQAAPRSEQPQAVGAAATAPLMIRAIDLNEYGALRDVNVSDTAEKTIRLPAQRLRLQLTLPEGSTKGMYTLRLLDTVGRLVSRGTARSQTGRTLAVPLDLRRVQADSYRLQLTHGEEAPNFYPVRITEKHRK